MEEKKAYIRQMLEEMTEEREVDAVYYMMRGMELAKRARRR